MRKSSTKTESKLTRRFLAICVSVCIILGSMSVFAYAAENENDEEADQAAVADTEEVVDAEEAVAEVQEDETEPGDDATAEVISEASTKVYGAKVGDVTLIGGNLDTTSYYTAKIENVTTVFRFKNTTLPRPTGSDVYGSYRWRFSNVTTDGKAVDLYGDEYKTILGIKITGGSGTESSPFTISLYYHEHNWDLVVNGDTVTASCTAAGCDLTAYPAVTICPPSSETGTLYYDGEQQPVYLSIQMVMGASVPFRYSAVTYEGKDTEGTAYKSTVAPSDAGNYSASLNVSVGNQTVTIRTSFTIQKAPIQVSMMEIKEPSEIIDNLTDLDEIMIHDGDKVDLCINGDEVEGAAFYFSLDGGDYSKNIPTATEPGEYTIEYELRADKNHILLGNLEGTLFAKVMNYEFVEGADSSWAADSEDGATFVVKRSREDGETFERFADIYIDGELVDSANYSQEPGSVKITLTNAYLKTVKEGDHTVMLSFNEGDSLTYEIQTSFTVKGESSSSSSSSPQTGEHAGAIVLVVAALMAVSGAAFIIKARKA